jgi:serine/threonine-protein kinase
MSGIPAGAGQLLGKRLGKFEILALLALGGTAEIYLARIGGAAGFEKYVVVKCLHDHLADDAEFVKMFLDEARLAAHLDHSNIVQTMELGQHEGRYYMVMEFLAGLSLAMIVRRAAERIPDTRIPVPLVLNILAQSCAGLHYAHEKAMNGKALNIVHRDISPQNLVISFEGVVKVVDFGIAKAEMRETRTRSGTIKGKFAYMSPEQCVANNVDRRTDVFALGVIAHELLTGRRLFKRPSPYETYQAVMECDVKLPSALVAGIDPALDQVIMRALTKDKVDRYPSAEAFGDALLGYLHHRGVGSGPGDVSRFFDGHFGQELEEHSARMRELISGRDISVDTGVSWGSGEIDEDVRRDDAGKPGGRTHDAALMGGSGDIEQLPRPGAGARSMLLDELGTGSRVEDDDEMPAERTRIESNPLERVNELERLVAKQQPTPSRLPPSGAVPLPAPPPGPHAPGPQAKSPPGMPPSGRFPDLANLPTVIAEPDPELAHELATTSPEADSLAHGPTSLANPALSAHAQTQIAPMPTGPSGAGPAGASPNGAPSPAKLKPYQPPRPHVSSSVPPIHQAPPAAQQGYPVLNAQLSAQIATGATVFPSERSGGPMPPSPPVPPSPPYPSGPGGPGGAAGMPGVPGANSQNVTIGPGNPGGALGPHGGYPQVPSPPRVPDSGPGHVPPRDGGYPQVPSPPRVPDSGPGHVLPRDGNGNLIDPQRAANLMSPVGQYYPEHVDWDAAASSPARAVPPWLLVILFVAALGVALALTIVIARLLR